MSNKIAVRKAVAVEAVANGYDDDIELPTLLEEAQLDRDALHELEREIRENLIACQTFDRRYSIDESSIVEQIDQLEPPLSYREWRELRQNCQNDGRLAIYQKVEVAHEYATHEYFDQGYDLIEGEGASHHPDRIYKEGGAEWLGCDDQQASENYAYDSASYVVDEWGPIPTYRNAPGYWNYV